MSFRWSSTFTLTLPTDREILITRQFAAPRRLMFEVMSQPEHLAQWWGPRSLQLVECQVDFRVGGSYRYVLRAPDGREFGFRGEYREIVADQKVVSTFEFDGTAGHGSVETMTLDEVDGITTLSVCCLYRCREDRDSHLNSGMESGARESHDRLELLIHSISASLDGSPQPA